MRYLFELGHSPHLADKELAQWLSLNLKKYKKEFVSRHVQLITTKKKLNLEKAMHELGGVVRVGYSITTVDQTNLANSIATHLQTKTKSNRITYTISPLNDLEIVGIEHQVKSLLKDAKKNPRFVQSSRRFVAPVKVLSQEISEYVLLPEKSDMVEIFYVNKVSDVFDWQKRDRDRPAVDAKSGVMPPKVARMILNLALNKASKPLNILDPFCGSGTIISEALLLGHNVIGSDVSQKAIDDTAQNIAWLKANYSISTKDYLLNKPAQKLTKQDLSLEPDCIVTEGDLGPVNPSYQDQPEIIEELETLYSEVLSNLASLQKKSARLVIALPKHKHPRSVKMISNLIDTCENSGYTLLTKPIEYGQRSAIVKRAICVFQKK